MYCGICLSFDISLYGDAWFNFFFLYKTNKHILISMMSELLVQMHLPRVVCTWVIVSNALSFCGHTWVGVQHRPWVNPSNKWVRIEPHYFVGHTKNSFSTFNHLHQMCSMRNILHATQRIHISVFNPWRCLRFKFVHVKQNVEKKWGDKIKVVGLSFKKNDFYSHTRIT